MKLQVALDVESLDEARSVLADVGGYVDIVEIGLLFYSHGYDALEALKGEFPRAEYLADVKISDGGYFCAKQARRRGAEYVTVMGVVDDETVLGAVRAAEETGIKIVADMVGCRNFYERVKQLDAMGVHYISVHTPVDLQGEGDGLFEQLEVARLLVRRAKLAVAGGIKPETIGRVLPFKPDIVVAGSALLSCSGRVDAARRMRAAIDEAEEG